MITVIGTPTVDFIAEVDDAFLEKHGLTKGICTNVDYDQQQSFIAACDYKHIPGGSGANIAASLGLLGAQTHFIGPFGKDDVGDMVRSSLTNLNVTCTADHANCGTQIVFTFLTPDGDRSFAAYYPDDMTLPIHQNRMDDFLLISGYALLYPRYQEAILEHVRNFKGKMAFCPNDISVIKEASKATQALYERADYVIMNRNEADALLKPHKTETLLQHLQKDGKSGGLTYGAEGAHVFTPEAALKVASMLNPPDFIDSNGAGDAFTAGYLYSLVQSYNMEQTSHIASKSAAVLLATKGARPPMDIRTRVFTESV